MSYILEILIEENQLTSISTDYYGARRIATGMAKIIYPGEIKYFNPWMNFNMLTTVEHPFYIDCYRYIDVDADGHVGTSDLTSVLIQVENNYPNWKGFENILEYIPEIFRRYDIFNSGSLNFNGK